MYVEKSCRKCGIILVVGDNWLESNAKKGGCICRRCQGIEAKKNRERNVANGMCSSHKDRPQVEGYTKCQPCLEQVRAANLKARNVPGICYNIGCDKPQVKGLTSCQEHVERDRENALRHSHRNNAKRLGMKFHPEVPYAMLFQFQDGKCWLCGIKSNGRALHRDHDHITGWVRGILCSSDNTILKSAGVDKSVAKAESYFIKYEMNQDRLIPILDYLENPPYFQLIRTLGLPVPTGTYEQYMKHYDLEEDI